MYNNTDMYTVHSSTYLVSILVSLCFCSADHLWDKVTNSKKNTKKINIQT